MDHAVEIKDYAFSPERLSIKQGDGVKWRNADSVRHSARRDQNPAFNTGFIAPGGESAVVRFDQVSSEQGYDYFCEMHPAMTGIIVVTT
jgi:plastocyanin